MSWREWRSDVGPRRNTGGPSTRKRGRVRLGPGFSVVTSVPIRKWADDAILADREKVPMCVDCVQGKVAGGVSEDARAEQDHRWEAVACSLVRRARPCSRCASWKIVCLGDLRNRHPYECSCVCKETIMESKGPFSRSFRGWGRVLGRSWSLR
jgi:hypothetical protein